MRWNTLTVMVKCTNAIVSWQSCDCLVLALHHMMGTRLCYGSLVSQTLPILFVTYGGNEWLTAGVVRFTRLVLWCVVCCFCLLMWYAEVSIHTSGMERVQHIHSCNVDHSVYLLFILITLTELAIKGHWFGINAVRELTNCLRHNTALRVSTLDPVPVSLDGDVNTGCSMPFLKRMLN